MDISLKQAFDLFLFDRETYCKEKTVHNYKEQLQYFLNFMEESRGTDLETIFINTITKEDLNAYIIWLRKRDKNTGHPFKAVQVGKKISCRSVRTYSIALKTFLNFLYSEEYLQCDLMKKFRLIKGESRQIQPLYETEVTTIDALFYSSSELNLRNICIVHTMLDAGLRSGEVICLKVRDIDFEHNIVLVRLGKGNKDRIVPLAGNLKKMLHEYITLYRFNNRDYLFVSIGREKKQITEDTIKSLFYRIRNKSEIYRLKPHLLRHTFATSYILGGGDMESLRLYLGHENYDTTKIYLLWLMFIVVPAEIFISWIRYFLVNIINCNSCCVWISSELLRCKTEMSYKKMVEIP